jgi:cell division protein FtsZ
MCFENERMGELVDASAPVSEAFGTGEEVMADTVRSVARMVSLPSILHVGLDELSQVFRGSEARCSFGHGVARGPDRIAESVEKAFGSVLLDGGRVLSVAGSVLVQVTADASLPLSELREIMRLVHDRVSDAAHLYLGVSTDPSASDAVEVTIMAASPMGTSSAFEESIPAEETGEESGAETGKPTKAGARRKAGARKAEGAETQEELPLDQAIRGRFKDIDPTMVDGQDLDIPTFIRLRMRLK